MDSVTPGIYEVHLSEHVSGPHVDRDATAFKAEDMVERDIYLGQVEIRPGEVAIFDVTVSPESD